MKILIVSQYFWPETFRINDLATALSERGHEVAVLTGLPNYPAGRVHDGYWSPSKGRESYGSVDVRRVPMVPRGRSGRIGLVLNYLSFASLATLAAPFICRERWDVVFVFQASPIFSGLPALLVRRLSKAPVFFWIQDLWPESLMAAGGTRSRAVIRVVGRMVSAIYDRCGSTVVVAQRGNRR